MSEGQGITSKLVDGDDSVLIVIDIQDSSCSSRIPTYL